MFGANHLAKISNDIHCLSRVISCPLPLAPYPFFLLLAPCPFFLLLAPCPLKTLRGVQRGVNVQPLAHQPCDFHVEIIEEIPPFLKKWIQVVGIIFKERRLAIGRLQRIPVQATPIAVVADAQVAHEDFRLVVYHGHRQCQRTIGRSDDTAVAVGLFLEMVHALYPYMFEPVQFLIPLNRSEIGGGKKTGVCCYHVVHAQ